MRSCSLGNTITGMDLQAASALISSYNSNHANGSQANVNQGRQLSCQSSNGFSKKSKGHGQKQPKSRSSAKQVKSKPKVSAGKLICDQPVKQQQLAS